MSGASTTARPRSSAASSTNRRWFGGIPANAPSMRSCRSSGWTRTTATRVVGRRTPVGLAARPASVLKIVLLPAPVGPRSRTTSGSSNDAARTRMCPRSRSASCRARACGRLRARPRRHSARRKRLEPFNEHTKLDRFRSDHASTLAGALQPPRSQLACERWHPRCKERVRGFCAAAQDERRRHAAGHEPRTVSPRSGVGLGRLHALEQRHRRRPAADRHRLVGRRARRSCRGGSSSVAR